MKTAALLVQVMLLISGLGLQSVAQAGGKEEQSLSIAKLRGPAWQYSLHGYGNLNVTRRPASNRSKSSLIRASEQNSQVGPLVLGNAGVVPPLSFTSGFLSRLEKNPSY